jgi:Uma2 family endonuclease/transposase-like protein
MEPVVAGRSRKRGLVELSLRKGVSRHAVAPEHGVRPNTLADWKRRYEAGSLGGERRRGSGPAATLVPVSVSGSSCRQTSTKRLGGRRTDSNGAEIRLQCPVAYLRDHRMSEMFQQQRRPISVIDFHRMGHARIFREEERLELVDGEIITIPPMGARHATAIARLTFTLGSRLGDRALVRVQLPAKLSDFSEPLPDVVVVPFDPHFGGARHPGTGDILWLIEVSDSSRAYDRRLKLPSYARHGVREVWIVDLIAHQLMVFRDPVDGEYRSLQALSLGDSVTPLGVPDVTFDVFDLLGPKDAGV